MNCERMWSTSLKNALRSSSQSMLLWRTLAPISSYFEEYPFITTVNLRFTRLCENKHRISPPTPKLSSFTITHLCQTLSKASAMAKATTFVSFPLSSVSFDLVLWLSLRSAENFHFWNQYCLLLIRQLVPKNVVVSMVERFKQIQDLGPHLCCSTTVVYLKSFLRSLNEKSAFHFLQPISERVPFSYTQFHAAFDSAV